MIKEFAFGLSKRHYFQDAKEIKKWHNISSDTFMSLYEYDDYIVEYYTKNKTLSGFDGNIYMPDEFILDIDGEDIDEAIIKTRKLLTEFNKSSIKYYLYFSGRGFHIHIPISLFKCKRSKTFT